jgi:hypothetical protein
VRTIQGHCRENFQSWEGALAYLLCNRTTSHAYLLYTCNWEFIMYRISSVPLVELKQFHTCVRELRSYKLICMFFYTATTTNELCHSGVHNCPHNCLRPLIYYTIKWLTVATIIPLWTHGSGGLRMYPFLTQASNFFQISSLYRDYLVINSQSHVCFKATGGCSSVT